MKKYGRYVGLLALALSSGVAWASAAEFNNVKMHCVFLKNSKVTKQLNCTADGYEHGNVYGAGHGYTFRAIKGYGKISVDSGVRMSETQVNADGTMAVEDEWDLLNGKPATQQWRDTKSFKLLTQQQLENSTVRPYTCYVHEKNAKYEFCYR